MCWRLLNKQVYFQSFAHPKCVRIEMVNIPNQTSTSGWSVGRCPIVANCSPESHFSMEFKLLLNSVTHLSKWDHWTRLVCTQCNKLCSVLYQPLYFYSARVPSLSVLVNNSRCWDLIEDANSKLGDLVAFADKRYRDI